MNLKKKQKDQNKIGKDRSIEKKNPKQSVHPTLQSQLIVRLHQL